MKAVLNVLKNKAGTFCAILALILSSTASGQDMCTVLAIMILTSHHSDHHKHNQFLDSVYSEGDECERAYFSSRTEATKIVGHYADEIPQYVLLAEMARKRASLIKQVQADTQNITPPNELEHVSRLMSYTMIESLWERNQRITYTYFRFLLGSITGRYLIKNNNVLPNWGTETQLSDLKASSGNLLSGSREGLLLKSSERETAEFFQYAVGISGDDYQTVRDQVFSQWSGDNTIETLVALVSGMVVKGAEPWFKHISGQAHTHADRESRFIQYLDSVSYKVVSLVFYILEHPDTFNSNYSYTTWLYGKKDILGLERYLPHSEFQSESVPYYVPDRFFKWSQLDPQIDKQLSTLKDFLESRNCYLHMPQENASSRTHLW